jgi:uncharacterized protein DUF4236
MGWRFRRTLSMGGFRGTISKQGLGGSWGLGGILRLGVSPDGRRYISIRIPGTGISWVKYYGRAISPPVAASGAATATSSAPSPSQTTNPQNPAPPVTTAQPWWKQKGFRP